MEIRGEWWSQKAWKLSALSHMSCPMYFFMGLFICIIYNIFMINGNCVHIFLWVLWATLANWSSPRRGSWEPQIYSLLVRSTGNNLALGLASEVGEGQVLCDWAVNLWDLTLSPSKCQNWVNCLMVLKKHTTELSLVQKSTCISIVNCYPFINDSWNYKSGQTLFLSSHYLQNNIDKN